MLLRSKKINLVVILIFSFLSVFFLKKAVYTEVPHLTASISSNDVGEFKYIIDILGEGRMLLQTRFTYGDKSYDYTRFFVLIKMEQNVFVINEIGVGREKEAVIERASKFDFFHSAEKLEVYKLTSKELVVHSRDKFLLLQR